MQSVAFFSFFSWLSSALCGRPVTVPGVGRGAGEIGGVGLPKSTGGQARIDRLALPATAQQRGETAAGAAFSFTGTPLFFLKAYLD